MTILHEHNLGYSAVPGAAHRPNGTFGASVSEVSYVAPNNFPYDVGELIENQLPSPPANFGTGDSAGATGPSDEQANEDSITGKK